MNHTVVLLTDFGTSDAYVGVMKGVMQRIRPDISWIDLTHDIHPQNVREAAFTLLNNYRYFAPGTIFLAVVDPGVGSARRAIAVKAKHYWFIAPDNGLLSYALADFEDVKAVELSNPAYHLQQVSGTFHGRDIFAPAAAYLASGVPLNSFGAVVTDWVQLPQPHLDVQQAMITGQVIGSDHFGNIITSIGQLNWAGDDRLALAPRFGGYSSQTVISAAHATVNVGRHLMTGIRRTYSHTEKNDLLALVGSSGYLEIAINQGSAAEQLKISGDEAVRVQIG